MNIKRIALGLMLVFGSVLGNAPESMARGPEVPFPMSSSVPFPWDKIEGIWEARIGRQSILFSFEKQIRADGRPILHVEQIDGQTGEIVSAGLGFNQPGDNLVRAAMAGSGANYMLYVGSYKNPNRATGAPRTLTVLTVRPFGAISDENDHQYVVTRIATIPVKGKIQRQQSAR